MLSHLLHRDAGLLQGLVGAAGGQDFDAETGQRPAEFDQDRVGWAARL